MLNPLLEGWYELTVTKFLFSLPRRQKILLERVTKRHYSSKFATHQNVSTVALRPWWSSLWPTHASQTLSHYLFKIRLYSMEVMKEFSETRDKLV